MHFASANLLMIIFSCCSSRIGRPSLCTTIRLLPVQTFTWLLFFYKTNRPASLQAGTNSGTKLILNYNLEILLWILNVLALRRMLHRSVTPKLRLSALSLPDNCLSSLQLSNPVSSNATCVACSLLLFIIEFTSSTSQSSRRYHSVDKSFVTTVNAKVGEHTYDCSR